MKLDGFRILGWAIPLFCIALAGFLIWSGYSRLGSANLSLSAAQMSVQSASLARDEAEKKSGQARFAAVPLTQTEEPKFLNGLRDHAATRSIKINRWLGHPASAPGEISPVAMGTQDPATLDPAIKSIIRVSGDLTIQGTYENIRNFLGDLSSSNRLYLLSDLKWARKDDLVELTVTVTRFLDPTLTPGDIAPDGKKRT